MTTAVASPDRPQKGTDLQFKTWIRMLQRVLFAGLSKN